VERTLRKGISARATRFVLGSCVPAGRERPQQSPTRPPRQGPGPVLALCRIAAETRVGVSLSARAC